MSLVLSAACWVESASQNDPDTIIRTTLSELDELALHLHRFPTQGGPESLHSTRIRESLEELTNLRIPSRLLDPGFWHSAGLPNRKSELETSLERLQAAIRYALDWDRVPRLAKLEQPAIRWEIERRQWQVDEDFPELGHLVVAHYQHLIHLNRDLAEIRRISKGENRPGAWRTTEPIEALRARASSSLADQWVRSLLDTHEAKRTTELPILGALSIPLPTPEGPRPQEIQRWLDLTATEAQALALEVEGCYFRDSEHMGAVFFQLDCYAYTLDTALSEIHLGLDLRLVYRSDSWTPDPTDQPIGLYFVFPVPPSRTQDRFRDQITDQLHRAVRGAWDGEARTMTDEAGSMLEGLLLSGENARIRIYRPVLVDFPPEQYAVQFRVERLPNPADLPPKKSSEAAQVNDN